MGLNYIHYFQGFYNLIQVGAVHQSIVDEARFIEM